METPKNAFLLLGYHGTEYFCNRDQELRILKDHRLNERNVVLFSWRRLGKSSLIQRFLIEEEQKDKFDSLYIDLMATTSSAKAIETIIQAVYKKYGSTASGFSNSFQKLLGNIGVTMEFDSLSGLPKFALKYQHSNAIADNLSTIGEFLSQRKKQVVIAFDEFQQISHYEGGNAEALFRQFMQSFPMIRFIFSGSHRQMMTSMFAESKRPFYRSCQMLSLEPIKVDDYTPFIQKHFAKIGRTCSEELIQELYTWARGQTYSIQLICNRLYGSYRKLDRENLFEVINEVLQEEAPVFVNYQHLLSNMQWKVISAIAKEEMMEQPQSAAFIQKYNLGAASSVKVALNYLMEKELVVQEGKKYFVHDLLFSRWLQRL